MASGSFFFLVLPDEEEVETCEVVNTPVVVYGGRHTGSLAARAHIHICPFLRSLNECGGSRGVAERDREQQQREEEEDESLEPRLVASASPGSPCGLEG